MTKTYTLTILSLDINENIEVEGYPADQPFIVDPPAADGLPRAYARQGHPLPPDWQDDILAMAKLLDRGELISGPVRVPHRIKADWRDDVWAGFELLDRLPKSFA